MTSPTTRMRASIPLLVLLAAVLPVRAAFRVTSLAPSGPTETMDVPRIEIVFSAPVVALGAAAPADAPPDWLAVDPPVLAAWRWAGTTTLIAEPKGPLPGATTWRLELAPSLRSLAGEPLTGERIYTFSTPPPAVIVMKDAPQAADLLAWAAEVGRYDVTTSLAPAEPIVLVWNQRMDGGTLAEAVDVRVAPRPLENLDAILPREQRERLSKTDREGWQGWTSFATAARGAAPGPASTTLEPDERYPGRVFRIVPRGHWPEHAAIEVRLRDGIRSLEGPNPGGPSLATFTTPFPFAPLGFRGREALSGRGLDPAGAELAFTEPLAWEQAVAYLTYRKAGETAWRRVVPEAIEPWMSQERALILKPLGLEGGAKYEVCLGRGLPDALGRPLAFPWCGVLTTAHAEPRLGFVEGAGVLEWDGPHAIPFSSVNVTSVRIESRRVEPSDLEAILREMRTPEWEDRPVRGQVVPVRAAAGARAVSPIGLDPVLQGRPGIVLTRLQAVGVVAGSEYDAEAAAFLRRPRTALTQITSLGLTVKRSAYAGTLVWVTRLADGTPVAGAEVTILGRSGQEVGAASTDASGLARLEAGTSSLPEDAPFLVTARDGDDVAFAGTRWYEGHRGWEFNLPVDFERAPPIVGAVWTDRGIVRPGEAVRAKAVLRRREASGLRRLAARAATFIVRDARDRDVVVKEVPLDPSGAAEIALDIPEASPLGSWSLLVGGAYDAEKRSFGPDGSWAAGAVRVAEFRRPKFRVATASAAPQVVAGDPIEGSVEGTLLAGGPMARARARWSVRATPSWWSPPGARWDGWEFVREAVDGESPSGPGTMPLLQGEGDLDASGRAAFRIPRAEAIRGMPARVEIEGEVEDIDRQTSASTSIVTVLPGEFFIGLKRPVAFARAGEEVASEIVAIRADGTVVAGITARLALVRHRWESVRRRDAWGRFVFESRDVAETVAEQDAVTADAPVALRFSIEEPGQYEIVARASDPRGNAVASAIGFYAIGAGYTPWRMDQENRAELVPEKSVLRPGETARILVKSPWERATALVTVERAGVTATRIEDLRGSTPVLEIPIEPSFVPNVFVSVVMLRGRIAAAPGEKGIDPGRPAYRIGYAEISVPPVDKKLAVTIAPDRDTYRPAETVTARVTVADARGQPSRAAVTLWAVDAGVLALTRYRTPDLVEAFHGRQGLGVTTSESRSRLIGRRSYGTKADRSGGGGGALLAEEAVRRDFRALAIWRGDVVTGDDGSASITFDLPDALTTYRLMAVAIEGDDRFGAGDREIVVTKPVGIEPALPRFLRPGDRARAGVIVRNRTAASRTVTVRARTIAGSVTLAADAAAQVDVPAGGSREAAFDLTAGPAGPSTLRFDAEASGDGALRDALEFDLPVEAVLPTETVATFFATERAAREEIAVPGDVWPGSGGLDARVASTALIGARPAVDWIARYPHGCAEQIASRLLGLLAAKRLGPSFVPAAIEGDGVDAWAARAVARLAGMQTGDGGFAYWPGAMSYEPLSAHVAWALAEARAAGIDVPASTVRGAAEYLSRLLRREDWPIGERDGWTTRVLATAALSRLDRPEPAYFQVLHDARAGRLAWVKAVLADAMLRADAGDPRAREILREVRGTIAVEARAARVQEPAPDWAWWLWWGERRGSAAALLAVLRDGSDPQLADRLAEGLVEDLAHPGRLTTPDTAWTLQALALYRERREKGAGARTAKLELAGTTILEKRFEGSEPEVGLRSIPMADLAKLAARKGPILPVDLHVDGTGLVHASLSLSYAPASADRAPLSQGLRLSRRFLTDDGGEVTGVEAGEEVVLEVAVEASALVRFLAVAVPIPAGLEPIDPELATAARRAADDEDRDEPGIFGRPGFDHAELEDDRVALYATEIPAGRAVTRVRCRATTPGRFVVAPARAEAMYAPEIFGTTAAATFEVMPRRGR